MLGQEWGGEISRHLHPMIMFQAMLHSLEKPSPLCCSWLHMFGSTLGLSLLFPRFTGARTKHLKPVVSRMWKLKCFHRRSEDQLRTEALHLHRTHYKHRTCCGSSVTRKIESCMALHLSWLSGPVCILNSLTNRDFAVGAITPLGISLSCSGGRKAISDQSRITSKRGVRSHERFLSDL